MRRDFFCFKSQTYLNPFKKKESVNLPLNSCVESKRGADRLQETPFKRKAFKDLEEKWGKAVISQGLLLWTILSRQFLPPSLPSVSIGVKKSNLHPGAVRCQGESKISWLEWVIQLRIYLLIRLTVLCQPKRKAGISTKHCNLLLRLLQIWITPLGPLDV